MDEKVANRVFEPYFTTKPQGKGTGLGLYISKTILQNSLNGDIVLQNNRPYGAKFIITINLRGGVETHLQKK